MLKSSKARTDNGYDDGWLLLLVVVSWLGAITNVGKTCGADAVLCSTKGGEVQGKTYNLSWMQLFCQTAPTANQPGLLRYFNEPLKCFLIVFREVVKFHQVFFSDGAL